MPILGIVEMPPCGLGNRMLYYNNLRQEAHNRGEEFFCVPWRGHELFEGDMLGNWKLTQLPKHEVIFANGSRAPVYDPYPFCLGERFYTNYLPSRLSTRDIFKFKDFPAAAGLPIFDDSSRCAIHFRGTDFHTWNPDSILKTQYYLDSIKEVQDKVLSFVLLTDDLSLESYVKVREYLDLNNLEYSRGENSRDRTHYVYDFWLMSHCDYIISSPSTYAICAGMIGKHKKIIHSEEWVLSRVKKNDKFWVDLYKGGNEDYYLWRLL